MFNNDVIAPSFVILDALQEDRGVTGSVLMKALIRMRWLDCRLRRKMESNHFLLSLKSFIIDLVLVRGSLLRAWAPVSHLAFEKPSGRIFPS